MIPGVWKIVGIGLAVVLLMVLGAGGGVWLTACHYRPLLDIANTGLTAVKHSRDNLETLAGEQGRKLGELVLAGDMRERNAAMVIAKAKEDAQPDYAAANKLLRDRTGGDPAESVTFIIDQELGL
ncbi:hypothetical protein TU86_17375 [Pseudomonas weihenstephanensis]|uniref:Uncharacterized protein n=1 Tax=Pseudomonas weihenstephanensis TaxID=1608994 RepID=A0A0J6ICT4_9PSED|nr:hypothetical protein [Pseudomonas weihenstephanensis]KMN12400.1 hypothetical protein TU86_17375 [Pseudomonas weihenstephanensis]